MQGFYETTTIENVGKRQPFLGSVDLFHHSISFGSTQISAGLWAWALGRKLVDWPRVAEHLGMP